MTSVSNAQLATIAREYGTPCWVYDAATIRRQIALLRQFDVIRYAQKASSNVHLLRLMRSEGVLVDAVSLGELERALAAGYEPGGHPSPIVLTTDVLDRATLERVVALKLPVNAGSPHMLSQLGERSPGHPVCSASIPALATATAGRPTLAASTRSTAFGTPSSRRRFRSSTDTASSS